MTKGDIFCDCDVIHADVVDKVSPAVVNIETKAPSNSTFETIYNDPF